MNDLGMTVCEGTRQAVKTGSLYELAAEHLEVVAAAAVSRDLGNGGGHLETGKFGIVMELWMPAVREVGSSLSLLIPCLIDWEPVESLGLIQKRWLAVPVCS